MSLIPDLSGVGKDAKYSLTIIALLVLALLLLFKEPNDAMKQFLVPSLSIYAIGTGFLGYLQAVFSLPLHSQANTVRASASTGGSLSNSNVPPVDFDQSGSVTNMEGRPAKLWLIVILHVIWVGCLIAYNFRRGSL